jgi:hypothetical protein
MSTKVNIWIGAQRQPACSNDPQLESNIERSLASIHHIAQFSEFPPVGGPQMNTRIILASLITAATLAACSSTPQISALENLGAQPTLDELNADNDSSLELAGSTGGLGNLLVRKIYDVNQNGKRDEEEPGIPDWGVRIVSVDANGNPDDAADIQVTPQGSQRWRGVSLKVPFGRYKIEELEPISTKQAGVTWKVTGQTSKIVNVSREKSVRAVEFAGVCLENGAVVKFPKIANFGDWKCRATFDLLPRIGSFTATPDQIQSGGSSTLAWNVLDYSSLEITPTVGVVTGFTGSRNVTPASTTAYTLKATNGFGSRTANVSVNVGNVGSSMKWQTPTLFDTVLSAHTAALVGDGHDRVMLIVSTVAKSNPDLIDLQASTYTTSSGWSSFENVGQVKKIQDAVFQFSTAIQARIAPNGDTFVWTANDDASVTVFRKPNAGVWEASKQINAGLITLSKQIPRLETDASGNALLLTAGCLQLQSVQTQSCQVIGSQVTRFTPQTGWSNPIPLEADFYASAMTVRPNGSAVITGKVAKYDTDPTFGQYLTAFESSIRAISFVPSTGGGSSRIIESFTPLSENPILSLTSNASGTIRMIWRRPGPTTGNICLTQFTDTMVETAQCYAFSGYGASGKAVINNQGQILAAENPIYLTPTNQPYFDTIVTQFVPNSGWGDTKTLFKGTYTPSDGKTTGQLVSDLSINENGIGYLSSSQFGKTPLPAESSWRYNPQAGWEDIGTAWSPNTTTKFTQTLSVLTLPNNTALAIGVSRDVNYNTFGLVFNTYR